MSQGMKRVVVVAPNITATRPTAVPALGTAIESGALTEDTLGQIDQFAYGTQLKNQLWTMPTDQQIEVYNTALTSAQQDAVTSAGYKLPGQTAIPEDEEEASPWAGGFLSDALHVADNVTGSAMGAVGTGVSNAGKALSWGSDQVKAGYRTATAAGAPGWLAFTPLAPVAASQYTAGAIVANAKDLPTLDGQTMFNSDRLKAAEEQIADPTVYFYAKQVAEGKSLETIMSELDGDPAKITGLTVLAESDKFKQAVDLLNGAHVSPGRDYADMLGMDPLDRGYNVVSGGMDGAFTVAYDPLLFAGPIGKGVQASKYGLSSIDNVGRLFGQKNVQRYMDGFLDNFTTLTDDAAEEAAKGAALATIRSQYKGYEPMIGEMRKAGVVDQDSLRDYLTSTVGFARLLQGKAAVSVPLMPYRTWAGEQARKAAAKANPISFFEARAYPKLDVTAHYDELATGADDATRETMESIIKSRHSILGRAATFGTRIAQKVPFGGRLYFDDDNAPEQVYKVARMVMPKYWADNTSAAFLSADVEGKRRIMKGLIETMGEVSGATKTAAGRKEWNKLLSDQFGEEGATHAYAAATTRKTVGANGEEIVERVAPDLMPDGSRAAPFAWQNRQYMDIPDFRSMYQLMVQLPMMEQAQRGGFLNWGKRATVAVGKDVKALQPSRTIGRVITNPGLDAFTEKFWKPGVLLRPALPLRNGLEETTNYIIRNSGKEYAKGVAGTRYVTDYAKSRTLAHAVGDEAMTAAKAGDATAIPTGFLKWRMRGEKAALSAEEERHLREFVELGGGRDVRDLMDDYTDMRVMLGGTKSQSGGAGDFTLTNVSGDNAFRELPTAGDEGAMQLATYANSVARSPDGKIALRNINDRDAAIRELVDWVESGDGAWMKHSSDQVKQLGTARWAENVYDATRGTFSKRDGELIDDLVQQGLDGDINPNWIIENLTDEFRPEFVTGQNLMLTKVERGRVGKAVNWGFEKSDEWVKQISRYPTFHPNYLRHRKNFDAFEKELVASGKMDAAAAKRLAHSRAFEAAFRDVMEYSDNPAVRSQAAIIMRNVFPFWRAQEEFYVRWAKTGIFNPYAYRKLQLTYQGLSSVGSVYVGENGEQLFNYPIVGDASQKVVQALSMIGVTNYLPVPIQTGSKVQYLNQGLDPNNILPSFGPGPSFALQSMRTLWPNTDNIERLLLGDLGAGRNPFSNFLPTPLRRIIDSDQERASMMMSAAAYLEYAGESPPPDATPQELQEYKEKLQGWSWGMTVMRTVFGAVLPASPSYDVEVPETTGVWKDQGVFSVKDEFYTILNATGDYGAAMGTWIKTHPKEMPFTVSQTETPSGAVVDANEKVGTFVSQNKAFFEKYPDAAPYWLGGIEGEQDWDTWDLLKNMGIKESKEFDEYYQDLKLSTPLQTYYDARDAHEAWQAEQQAAGAPAEVLDAEQERYDSWNQMYKTQNPLLQDHLAEGGSRAQERETTIAQLESALIDPNVPQTASTVAIQSLLAAHRAHQGFQAQSIATEGSTTAALDARKAETASYEAYMSQVAATDTAAGMVWNVLLRYA